MNMKRVSAMLIAMAMSASMVFGGRRDAGRSKGLNLARRHWNSHQ